MTLIIAKATQSSIFLAADTKLTYSNNANPVRHNHCFEIKTFIVDDRRCVAYAGNSECAHDAAALISHPLDNEEISSVLINSTNQCNDVEYLLCTLDPSPRIQKISNGETEALDSAWIGDYEAFRLYQSYSRNEISSPPTHSSQTITLSISPVNSYNSETDKLIRDQMVSSFKSVVRSLEVPSVGGLTILVSTDDSGFKFDNYSEHTQIPEFLLRKEIFSRGCPYGDSGNSAYSVDVSAVERHKIAVYILEANLGVTFSPIESIYLKPSYYSNHTSSEFKEKVKNELGEHTGISSNKQPVCYYRDAWFYLKKSEFDAAIFLLDKGIASSSKFWAGYPVPLDNDYNFTSLSEFNETTDKVLSIPNMGKRELALAFYHRGYSYLWKSCMDEAVIDLKDSLIIDPKFKPSIHLILLIEQKFFLLELKQAYRLKRPNLSTANFQ